MSRGGTPRRGGRRRGVAWLIVVPLVAAIGCASPSRANIELRKKNQQLEQRLGELERQREADRARLLGLESGASTVPFLPQQRLDHLVTVHAIQLGRLTEAADLDRRRPGDEGLRVQLVPLDADGEEIKAAGAIVVEAFDLGEVRRLGRWEFPASEVLRYWHKFGGFRAYVLTCAWQAAPSQPEITVRVAFTDELTGRRFSQQQAVRVQLPHTPATTQTPQAE